MPVRRTFALALALASGLAVTAPAQSPRGPDVPDEKVRLVLNTGGHTNQVRALVFSSDGQRLYSAGLDKIVLGWELRERRPLRRIDASLVQTLHWEIARGMRGAVMELAMSSGGDRLLAMGGVSARGQGGDITIYDSAAAQVQRTLRELQNSLATGGLAFSPDGTKVAAISVHGDAWLWTAPDFTARQLRPIELDAENRPVDRPYRALTFLNNQTLAIAVPVGQPGRDRWGIELHDLEGGAPPRLLRAGAGPFELGGAVTALVRDPNSGRWATADKSGAVYLGDGTVDQRPTLLRQGREALDLAFGPGGTLFIATRLLHQPGALRGVESAWLEHWTTDPPAKVDELSTSTSWDNYACAVSPDGKWLATCGDDRAPILVFALRDGDNRLIEKPLTARGRPRLSLRGVGTALGKAAFAVTRDGRYQIGFGPAEQSGEADQFNNYGSVSQVFDLTKGELLPEEKAPRAFRSPDANAGGWTVKPERNRTRLLLKERRGYQCTIDLDPLLQGEATCYGFLARGQRPFAVAVGTNHQNGIYIYQLVTKGSCPLLRYYRDHAYVVTSLSVSQDGAYLASASLDQTIKLWSLQGLSAWEEIAALKQGPFPQAVAWGAVFSRRGNQVVASDVKPAGIAYTRGVREGDIVEAVLKVEGGAAREFTAAEDILSALQRTTLFEQAALRIRKLPAPKGRRDEESKLLPIVPAWEPVATLFIDRRGEWALFTPQGPYDASVNGDQLFGWQFNRGGDATPEFLAAEQLRRLEQPEKLRRLFAAGEGALSTVYSQISDLVARDKLVRQASLTSPVVQIVEPKDGVQYEQDQEVVVKARVVYPTGSTAGDAKPASRHEVSALINAADLGEPVERRRERGEETLVWRTRATEAYNRLLVRIEEPGAPPGAPFDTAAVNFRAAAPQSRPRLHVLVLAVDQYPDPLKLEFPVKDATALVNDLNRLSAPLYQAGEIEFLKNEQISKETTPEKIAALCEKLKHVAQRDDLLMVYIAGHGAAFDGQYFFVPPHAELKKLDRGEEEIVKRIGVPWEALLQLREIPCRKLVLLDTCHSGNAVLAEDSLKQQKAFTRPLRDRQMLVVSATGVNQFAWEVKKEGVFTRCVREGIAGKADGLDELENENANTPDGEVNVLELVRFVTREVPKRTRSIGLQTPTQSPEQLFKELHIPLAAYEAANTATASK